MKNQGPMTLSELAIERVVERAKTSVERPAQHTLLMNGTPNDRRQALDRIEARLRYRTDRPPRIGRLREPYGTTASSSRALFNELARTAGLDTGEEPHNNGLGRIQHAAGERLFVAMIDNLDALLASWSEGAEALNLRWAMQNINGLLVVAASKGPISGNGPYAYEYSILGMTFATQSLGNST